MAEEPKELLSAVADGELDVESTRRVLDEALADAAQRATLGRYHLIGDALRGTVVLPPGELVARLVGRLPRAETASPPARPHARAGARRAGRARPARFALAASLVGAGLLGFFAARQLPVVESTGEVALVVSATSPEEKPDPRAQLVRAPDTAARWRGRWDTEHPSVRRRLQGYLVNHSEYLGRGMRGMHPYARVVTYQGMLADAAVRGQ